jgi:hypothetical protein
MITNCSSFGRCASYRSPNNLAKSPHFPITIQFPKAVIVKLMNRNNKNEAHIPSSNQQRIRIRTLPITLLWVWWKFDERR